MNGAGRLSQDVRIWSVIRYKGTRGTTYRVRWHVAGHNSQRSFRTAKLADAFRAELIIAAREGQPFDPESGLPCQLVERDQARTWYEHAVDYASRKWRAASPRHRKGIAEALMPLTIALSATDAETPQSAELRRALFRWAFNDHARLGEVPDEYRPAISWLERQSLPLQEVARPAIIRRALEALAVNLDGRPAANSTFSRKRATFHNALEYAVELELLAKNPLENFRWTGSRPTGAVDRRVVANPTQARALLDTVWEHDPPLAGFFACLYYAGLRPAEARNLRLRDCDLPEEGWGVLQLSGSHQSAGSAWTDSGLSSEERALKHRAPGDTRRVPRILSLWPFYYAICPTLP